MVKLKFWIIWVSLLLTGVCLAGNQGDHGGDDYGDLTVDGVFGLMPVEENSCIAVFVPVSSDQALAGVRWYNNDGIVIFPQLLLATGATENPVALPTATVMLEEVNGSTSDWSEVLFDAPVASASEGLYVIFRLPEGSVYTAEGEGGGAGIGYRGEGNGLVGWLSLDGEDWIRLHPNFSMAVQPILVEAEPGMMVMREVRLPGETEPEETSVPLETVLLPAQPNPFNPITKIKFNLKETGRVQLSVYNVRGALVNRLTDKAYSAGRHSVEWRGVDFSGRTVPSGVYFIRFTAENKTMVKKIALIR